MKFKFAVGGVYRLSYWRAHATIPHTEVFEYIGVRGSKLHFANGVGTNIQLSKHEAIDAFKNGLNTGQ